MIWLKIKKFLDTYQELIFWMPPALLLLFLAFKLIPAIDPRSGIDGFGQLFAMLTNTVGGIMVCFSAWLTKRCYFGVWSDEDVLQFQAFMISTQLTESDKRALLFYRLLDLVVWILCFGFWSWVIF